MSLVQVTYRQGEIKRVPRGQDPFIEIELDDRQRIIAMDMRRKIFINPERKTDDWTWWAFVETRL